MEDFDQSYQYLVDFFGKNPLGCSLSELHGMILGYQVADQDACFKTWSSLVTDDIPLDALPEKVSDQIKQLFLFTHIQICQENMDLDLLIPEKSSAFLGRVKALSDLSRGFLYGFGIAQSSSKLLEISSIGDMLNEMTQFSQIDVHYEQSEQIQDELKALDEIIDYVKNSLRVCKRLCAKPELQAQVQSIEH